LILEHSLLLLIKKINEFSPNLLINIFKGIKTTKMKIINFLLKINSFVKSEIILKKDFLVYALIGRDFYSVIYAIEGSRRNEANNDNNDIRVYKDEDNSVDNTNVMVNEDKTNAMDNIELLQLAYYMINDLTRVKAFNIKNNGNNNMNLFYDFLLNKNYSAARECLKEIQNGSFSLKRQTNLLKMDIFRK
jgi:hypothetical protein